MCNQANGYSVLFDSPLGCAGEHSLATREEWTEGKNILLSVKCWFRCEDLRVFLLDGVDDLKDPAFCQDLRDYI